MDNVAATFYINSLISITIIYALIVHEQFYKGISSHASGAILAQILHIL